MTRWSIIAMTAILGVAANPLSAQQHPHGQTDTQQAHMGGMMERMMESMHPGPEMLLHAGDVLGLSADQRHRLEQTADRSQEEHQRHMQAAMEAHRRAAAALESERPDLDAYETAFREAANHMALAHVAMTRAAVEARAVLTPEQRQKLADAMALTRAMKEAMGEGMMGGMQQPGGHD
jgi:uncharacterized membrane protein